MELSNRAGDLIAEMVIVVSEIIQRISITSSHLPLGRIEISNIITR